jgi:hypothetical protein
MACRLLCAAIMLAGLATPAARASSDGITAPLKYRLVLDPAQEIGATGQVLSLGIEKPAALIDEPSYRALRLYASAQFGVQPRQHTIVLDCSAGGHFEALYVDTSGTGRLASATKISGFRYAQGVRFGPVKILVDDGHGRSPQWFWFQVEERTVEGKPQCQMRAIDAGCYQGMVAFGNRKHWLGVIDQQGHGLFNEFVKSSKETHDVLHIEPRCDEKPSATTLRGTFEPLGRYVYVDDSYWLIEVAPDGSWVRVQPSRQPMGRLRCYVGDTVLLLEGPEGVLHLHCKGQETPIPVGDYRLVSCRYQVRGTPGTTWEFSGKVSQGEAIQVLRESITPVAIGPPFVARVKVSGSSNDFDLGMVVRGAGGEECDLFRSTGGQQPPPPRVHIRNAQGREIATLDFHYG